jgi:hypothetical protein
VPAWNASAIINGVSAAASLGLSLAFENTTLLSFDPMTGFLGLFTSAQLGVNLLNAVMTGICCATLISLCSRHLEPMIVTTGLLFEPLTATLIGWLLNIEKETSLLTWLLMLVIINSLYEILTENQELEEVGRLSKSSRLSEMGKEEAKEGVKGGE